MRALLQRVGETSVEADKKYLQNWYRIFNPNLHDGGG